jgi:hypothetical protein
MELDPGICVSFCFLPGGPVGRVNENALSGLRELAQVLDRLAFGHIQQILDQIKTKKANDIEVTQDRRSQG